MCTNKLVVGRGKANPASNRPTGVSLSNDKIDGVDRAIIEMLRLDGRRSNRSMGQALAIGESAVANRIHRLEEASVMRVVAVTDMQAFGHRELAFAMLRVTGRSVLSLTSELAKLPETIGVTAVIGRFDLIVPVLGRDRRHLAQLFGRVLPLVSGIDSINGHIALDVLKFESKWGVLTVDPGNAPDATPSDTVDELDLGILERLQVDARRSFRSVAGELSVSERTIRERVKRLSANRVIKIQAVSDIESFGLNANGYIGITVFGGLAEEVGNALVGREDVVQVTRTLGEFDFIAVVLSADRKSLIDKVFSEIATLRGVRRAELFEAWANNKHNYAWSWLV